MYRPPYQGAPYPNAPNQPNQPRNFGSDLHAMLSGLSRIVQLLFTGIPVLSFIGTVSRFLWKFAAYLGCATTRALPAVGDLAVAEEAWSRSAVTWSRVKLALLVALGLVGLRIVLRRRQIEAEEGWESASETEEMEEAVPLPAPETIKSEEGRQPLGYPQMDQYQEDYWDNF